MTDDDHFNQHREFWGAGQASFPDRKMQRVPPYFWRRAGAFDWTGCPDVEVVVGRLSDVPTLAGTRFSADNLLALYEDGMSENEIVENYEVDADQVRRILQFARERNQNAQAA